MLRELGSSRGIAQIPLVAAEQARNDVNVPAVAVDEPFGMGAVGRMTAHVPIAHIAPEFDSLLLLEEVFLSLLVVVTMTEGNTPSQANIGCAPSVEVETRSPVAQGVAAEARYKDEGRMTTEAGREPRRCRWFC